MKLCYQCYYDGRKCDKEVPQFRNGVLQSPTTKEIKKQFGHVISDHVLDGSWDVCTLECERVGSCDTCHGKLAVEEGYEIKELLYK